MKPLVAALLGLSLLAGCGADGPPLRPSLTGSVSIGPGGVSNSTQIGLQSGPVSLGVSL